MSYPEDQFSNAVAQYATTIAIPTIKTDSKITDNVKKQANKTPVLLRLFYAYSIIF
jgi:hypothetical protein